MFHTPPVKMWRRFGRVLPPFADTWDIQHPGRVMKENRVVVDKLKPRDVHLGLNCK